MKLARLTLLLALTLAGLLSTLANPGFAGDWPMWRYNSGRNAAAPDSLPEKLQLQWTRHYAAPQPAWPEDPRLTFDGSYEPVVMGRTLFLASAQNDSVTAIDTRTGEEKWQYFAEGPVRFAPVAHDDTVYFGSDDGCLYALAAADGKLRWKFDAADSARKVIGNDRLVSVWPVRGGPVLSAGKLYFTVGVWPFEGTFLYVLDLSTTPSDGTPPSHTVEALPDLTPQGYLALSGERLYIPCGRGVPAYYHLGARAFQPLRYNVRGLTDYHATASGSYLFHAHRILKIETRQMLPINAPRPVADGSMIYIPQGPNVVAADLENQPQLKQDGKANPEDPASAPKFKASWHVTAKMIAAAAGPGTSVAEDTPLSVDIKSGKRVYGRLGKLVFAADEAADGRPARVSWARKIAGEPTSLIAADDRLFVATRDGTLHCFGGDAATAKDFPRAEVRLPAANAKWQAKVTRLLQETDARGGFCLVWGIDDGSLVEELLRQSELRVVAIDPDAKRVAALRERLDDRGLYGYRAVALAGEPAEMRLPPYLANLLVSEDPSRLGDAEDEKLAAKIYHPLRPYGGAAVLALDAPQRSAVEKQAAELSKAKLTRLDEWTMLAREGALEGSANWSHEYGDASNSLMSRDQLVKMPLGVLWFGGPAADTKLFFDRHFWGPSLTVIDGRMFLQGHTTLGAADIYTGRMLWEKTIVKGSSPGRRGNFYDGDDHTGYHFCAVPDAVYLTYPKTCLKFDPVTGKTLAKLAQPIETGSWGRIRVWKDLLIGAVFDSERLDGAAPTSLVAVNRHTGKLVWRHDAVASCPIVAIGGDRVFFFDGHLKALYNDIGRGGVVPKTGKERLIKALDVATGDVVWEYESPMTITWLAYAEDNEILVAANRQGIQARRGEDGSELWSKQAKGKGFIGHPESRWDRVILWKDRIIDQRGPGVQYFVETGDPITREHPISGEQVKWEFTAHGHNCAYAIASEHLMTFRAATAGFADLASSNTGRLNGFRSGCRNSLIPAGGVMNAPNFAHGCDCDFNLFTSLALVHQPENDVWMYSALASPEAPVSRVGINLAAPGDRIDERGILWMDYPSKNDKNYRLPNVKGPSPEVPVTLQTDQPRWFRNHPTQVEGGENRWVAASGVEGLKTLTVEVNKYAESPRPYKVTLYFAEPLDLKPGERVFDVTVGEEQRISDLDVAQETGGRNRMLVKEFTGVPAAKQLTIELSATAGQPVLCGVEIVAEEDPEADVEL
ncbi:MAG: hypothetical protein DWQ31_12790 [Planctomycetota bacterium]|nr:MAG: hypothetical protein DWQ31_12790 [Planctomycetota bacterium]REJ95650.1 MAG: hypothetical protein DWQ35_06030 [Planctomycetota bacterium]